MKKLIILLFLLFSLAVSADTFADGEVDKAPNRGVWVSVFSSKKVLYSKAAADELLKTCKDAGINQIYLQVYQSGRAFYDSKISDPAKYKDMVRSAGMDTLDYILREAKPMGIKVFAWINLLSLGQNSLADIIRLVGPEVLTRDQYLRPSGRKELNATDKYYLQEENLFLEPGDPRVVDYLVSIVEEVVARYPSFSGVHLDYVRYPMTVPFIPGSRFTKYGLSYGYGQADVARFKEWTGLDPLTDLVSDKQFSLWDDWRRQQVTQLVRQIAKRVKIKASQMLVSSAVVPSPERAYSAMFQNWAGWLEEGIVDYVVLMNYTLDNQLAKENVRSALAQRQLGKVYAGLGVFLMKNDPQVFKEQYLILKGLDPDGIVFFAYEDITPDIALFLRVH